MPAEPRSLKEVFLAALAIAPAERAAWLEQACGQDAELRQRAELMLAAHDSPQSLLDRPTFVAERSDAVTGACTGAEAERPDSVIGHYKLLQQIGEGGMGTVFMAEQTQPVQRKVALKVIKAGMDSRQVIARFEAERQALAMMDHVNIARVFDAGATESERPYFVMELVRGVPITKYCDDNHLTPRQRLELFVPVCQAIQHAHQKGIIHRDIKPSNVMITLYDGKPVPKVIDFGVAKATEQKLTERTLFTQYGTLVGTLEYMSPEQAETSALGVDTRSDIFSLGVLLYELLTGSTPLSHKRVREAAYAEILRMIREEEPPSPSTRLSESGEALASISAQRHMEPAKLTKLVRGELDWIVMKTLEKDRNRRYETVSGFAADVQRYLNDEPVQACPPSAGYRLRKFVRRNKRALAMVAVAAVAVLIATTSLGWSVRDRQARQREASLETARRLAVTEQGIRQALDRGTKSSADLHTILKKSGGVQQLLNQPARWELLIKTAQGELAQAQQSAVRTEGRLDAESTQEMNRLEQQIASDQADYDLALRLEKIRLDRATVVNGKFDIRKAADEYSKAFDDLAVLKDDPGAVAARLAPSPIKDQLVAALDDWAWVAFTLREPALAEQLLALARHLAPDPAWGDRLRRLGVWRDREALGKLVAEAPLDGLSPQLRDLVGSLLGGNRPLAESWLRRAQAEYPADFWVNFRLSQVIDRTDPVEAVGFSRVALVIRPGNSAVYTSLGAGLDYQGKRDEAIACYRKAIEIDPRGAVPYSNLGITLHKQGKLDEAISYVRKAIEIDPKFANAHSHLGNALAKHGKRDEAIACYRKAIEIDPKFADPHAFMGGVLQDQGKLDEAVACYHKAIEIDPRHVQSHNGLGLCLKLQGKFEEAIASYRKAIEIDPKYVFALLNLSYSLANQRKFDEAIALCRRSIELDPKFARARGALAHAIGKQGWDLADRPDPKFRDPQRAVELGKEAVASAPQSPMGWQLLGWIQYRAGNWKDSIAALEKSRELQEGGTGDAFQWLVLAMAHWQLGHKEEARNWYEKAIELERVWPEELRRFRAEAEELMGVNVKKP
jgi:eukaryotic-like serine/threonine-protein kinase